MPLPLNQNTRRKSESGAALLTVTVILALVSVLISIGLKIFHTEEAVDRRDATRQQMEFVIDQLSSYVQKEWRMPCPADPSVNKTSQNFGVENRIGGTASNSGCTIAAGAGVPVGIIPFRTLNIPESYIRDEWGHFITYAISPVFAETRNPAAVNDIFYICRKKDIWMNSKQTNPPPLPGNELAATNENNSKAAFCCPGASQAFNTPNNDLEIRDENGNQIRLRLDHAAVAPGTPQRTAGASLGLFGSIIPPASTIEPDTVAEPIPDGFVTGENVVAFAVVLVSHGANGLGAFDGAGAVTQIAAPPAGTAEFENANLDKIFTERPTNIVEGNQYFDDIVLWRSQFSLYNELNNATCARPWR